MPTVESEESVRMARSLTRPGTFDGKSANAFIALSLGPKADKWTVSDWNRLVQLIRARSNLPIFLIGEKSDKAYAEEFVKACSGQFPDLSNLCGQPAENELVGIVNHALFVVARQGGLAWFRPEHNNGGILYPVMDSDTPDLVWDDLRRIDPIRWRVEHLENGATTKFERTSVLPKFEPAPKESHEDPKPKPKPVFLPASLSPIARKVKAEEPAVFVNGYWGLGDCIYQRPFVAALARKYPGRLFVSTPYPELYADIDGIRFPPPGTSLRAQGSHIKTLPKETWTKLPDRFVQIPLDYSQTMGSGRNCWEYIEQSIPLTGDLVWRFEPPTEWIEKGIEKFPKISSGGKLCLMKLPTLRSEWHITARNPKPEYFQRFIDRYHKEFSFVSFSNNAEGKEWFEGDVEGFDARYDHGELDFHTMVGLVACADFCVTPPGFLLALALMLGKPVLLIAGGYMHPLYLTDPRMGLANYEAIVPIPFCHCLDEKHECNKTIEPKRLLAGFESFVRRIGVGVQTLPIAGKGHSEPSEPALEVRTRTSIVCSVFNGLNYTKGFIASLQENAGCEYELVMVDDGSTDGSGEWLASQPGVTLLKHDKRQGVANSWNHGLRTAKGDILILLNNDILVHPDAIKRLSDAAEQHGIAGQTGGVVYNGGWLKGAPTLDRRQSQYIEGYCLAFRRDVWEKVGEFDEAMKDAYCEDADWSFRAREKGFNWVILPDLITHFGGKTTGGLMLQDQAEINFKRLLDRYRDKGLGLALHVNRSGAAGDVIMALTAVRALREKYPMAWITFSCVKQLEPLADACADVNAVGQFNGDARRFDLDGVYETFQNKGTFIHPVDSFCKAMGLDRPKGYARLELDARSREWAGKMLKEYEGHKLIVCGARSAYRRIANWREARWMELFKAFPNHRFVMLDPARRPSFDFDPANDGKCPELWEQPNVVDLTGATDMIQALAVLELADAAVTVDSGLLHFAAVMDRPTLTLVNCVPLSARLTHRTCRGIQGKCKTPLKHDGKETCMDTISSHDVIDALRSIFHER